MQYRETMRVEARRFDALTKSCEAPNAELPRDTAIFDVELRFPDGNRVAIQVCSPLDPAEESCWTQAVLFDKAGNELSCTDVGETLGGEYCVSNHDTGDEYVVVVQRDPPRETKEQTAIVTVEVTYDPATTTPEAIADKVERFLDNVVATDGIWDECISDTYGSPGLGGVTGRKASPPATGSAWDSDPEYPLEDWQYEVANGDTVLGYQDWLKAQKEAAKS